MREAGELEIPDFTAMGVPMKLQTAQEYFRVKGVAMWGADIRLEPGDTWDDLGDRLGERLGIHIWHPVHWEALQPMCL